MKVISSLSKNIITKSNNKVKTKKGLLIPNLD